LPERRWRSHPVCQRVQVTLKKKRIKVVVGSLKQNKQPSHRKSLPSDPIACLSPIVAMGAQGNGPVGILPQ
jgi:hypothetical protein